jgi:hypothetical protein
MFQRKSPKRGRPGDEQRAYGKSEIGCCPAVKVHIVPIFPRCAPGDSQTSPAGSDEADWADVHRASLLDSAINAMSAQERLID